MNCNCTIDTYVRRTLGHQWRGPPPRPPVREGENIMEPPFAQRLMTHMAFRNQDNPFATAGEIWRSDDVCVHFESAPDVLNFVAKASWAHNMSHRNTVISLLSRPVPMLRVQRRTLRMLTVLNGDRVGRGGITRATFRGCL